MLNKIGFLLLIIALLPFGLQAEEEYIEGINYERIVPPLPAGSNGKVEVRELFWYGCPHCYQFEPKITKWKNNLPDYVEFIATPAIFNNPRWKLHATAYYTAEVLDVIEQIHSPLFAAIHNQKRAINTEDQLREFFIEQGVSAADFDKTFNSFSVKAKVARAADLTKKYGITGVPVMVVQGKYRIDGQLAGSYDNLLKIVNYLAEMERK